MAESTPYPRAAPHGRPAAHRAALYGRDAERRAVRGLLEKTERGPGGVVLVDGAPGTGKSTLLGDACREAAERGFSLVSAAADPLAHATPLFTLRAALHDPLTGPAATPDCPAASNPFHQLAGMRGRLEQRAASAPLLVCLDDLHRESEGTLAAVRSLQRDLRGRPAAWLLARSSAVRSGADRLFDLLEGEGAVRVTLAPLAQDATELMLGDAFGAPPDPGLAALARDAAGIPALLVELIGSLRESRAVEVRDGRAVLTSRDLPPGCRQVAQRRLWQVSGQTRHLLLTAAALGPTFPLEDAASMLGQPPAALLPAIEEAIDAALVRTAEHGFAFCSELLRRAAADMIPAPARRALHRQYSEILFGRGAPAADAASHLLEAADPADPASLPGLDHAVARALRSAPHVAAELAVRALELTRPGDPEQLPRSVTAAEALAAAGRLEHALAVAEAARARPLPQLAEHRLRCVMSWVLCTRGRPQEAAAEAAAVLGAAQLPRDLRARARSASLQALTAMPAGCDPGTSGLPDPQRGPGADPAGLILQASRCWDAGQVGESLELARDAARGAGFSPDARDAQPLLVLAATLADMRELGDAEAVLGAVTASDLGGIPAGAALTLLRGRVHLAAGRLSAACSQAEAALAHALDLGADSYIASARSVLAVIELRRGRVEMAAAHIGSRPLSSLHIASIYARPETSLAEAQVVEATGGPVAAIGSLAAFCSDLPARPGALLADPALAAWLVRAALAAGEDKVAAAAAEAAATAAAGYPGFSPLHAGAAHSLGVLHRDPASLARAVREHADPWARASASEDLGVLRELKGEREAAVDSLTSALTWYGQLEARRDEARVRARLRGLGVRRRHWSRVPADGPADGWRSLTATEQAIACLVAEGLNNNQIAARRYISTHTVAHHLRQAFSKLAVASRVELARVVFEQAGDETVRRGGSSR